MRESDAKCLHIVQCIFVPSDFSPDCGQPDYRGPAKREIDCLIIVVLFFFCPSGRVQWYQYVPHAAAR